MSLHTRHARPPKRRSCSEIIDVLCPKSKPEFISSLHLQTLPCCILLPSIKMRSVYWADDMHSYIKASKDTVEEDYMLWINAVPEHSTPIHEVQYLASTMHADTSPRDTHWYLDITCLAGTCVHLQAAGMDIYTTYSFIQNFRTSQITQLLTKCFKEWSNKCVH